MVSGVDGLMTWRWKAAGLLLVSLVCWEMMVRFFVVSPANIVHDPMLGAMKAGDTEILRTYEGFSRFKTDVYGFNNDSLPSSLPARRLLFLGDSFVESEQVARKDNFVSKVNTLPKTLAYNAGFSGADPRAFLTLLHRFIPVLHPTQVVLCVNGGDLSALTSTALPSYGNPSGLKKWLQPIFASSSLMTHLNWKYKPEIVAWWQHLQPEKEGDAEALASMHMNRLHWQRILELLKKSGIPLSLVIMPSVAYSPEGIVFINSTAANMMAEVAEDLHIHVLRTEQSFMEDFVKNKRIALGFSNAHLGEGHLNEIGHTIVANLIIERLVISP